MANEMTADACERVGNLLLALCCWPGAAEIIVLNEKYRPGATKMIVVHVLCRLGNTGDEL